MIKNRNSKYIIEEIIIVKPVLFKSWSRRLLNKDSLQLEVLVFYFGYAFAIMNVSLLIGYKKCFHLKKKKIKNHFNWYSNSYIVVLSMLIVCYTSSL